MSWFPGLLTWTGAMDGYMLVEKIYSSISASTHSTISSPEISTILAQFFKTFEPQYFNSRTDCLSRRLQHLLSGDIHGSRFSGLRASRQSFLTLACLAHITLSEKLAEALVAFLSAYIYLVVQHEASYHIREWGVALHELRGLVYDPTLQELLACLMPSQWRTPITRTPWLPVEAYPAPYDPFRGRLPLRALPAPACWAVSRARSAPGYRYRCPSPDWRRPRIPQSAWASPALSPRKPPRVNDFFNDEDYEALRIEQDAQAAEVDELSQQIRAMEGTY